MGGPALPARDVLDRPRLVDALLARFDVPIVVLRAGPGFGKTTLLAQAIAANEADARGIDRYLACRPTHAAASVLSRDLMEIFDLGGMADGEPGDAAAAITNAMSRYAPMPIAVVLDDVHHLEPGTAGAALIQEVADRLPANAHLVLSTRASVPVRIARAEARGEVVIIAEDDLRMTPDEVEVFADSRGVPVELIDSAAGWPAVAELIASRGGGPVSDFLGEEVTAAMEPARLQRIAVLADLGRFDAEIAAAALGTPDDVGSMLEGLPLVARDSGGWFHIHGLWRDTLDGVTDVDARRRSRAAAAAVEAGRGRVAEAFDLLAGIDAWTDAAALIARCTGITYPPVAADVLDRWARALPEQLQESPIGLLVRGISVKTAEPARAGDLLRAAADGFQASGEMDLELTALAHLGHVARWRNDAPTLLGLVARGVQLHMAGVRDAALFVGLGNVVMYDAMGDHHAALVAARSIDTSALNDEWLSVVEFLEANQLLYLGEAEACRAAALRAAGHAGPMFAPFTTELCGVAAWDCGHLDESIETLQHAAQGYERAGLRSNLGFNALMATTELAVVGRPAEARAHLERARDALGAAWSQATMLVRGAEACIALAEGDEAAAREHVNASIAEGPISDPARRRMHVRFVALPYLLAPETRDYFDSLSLGPRLLIGRDLATALAAYRERQDTSPAASLRLPAPGVVRSLLPVPWVAQLASALHAAGRREGVELVLALGAHGRHELAELARVGPEHLRADAAELLRASPAAPAAPVRLRTLGGLELWRGDERVDDPDWRRPRVRELLVHLVVRRRAARHAIAADIWPDAGSDSAANNLRVTLSYLMGVLDPARGSRETSVLVATDAHELRLVPSPYLTVDLWDFEAALDRAAVAERTGTVAESLRHLLDAIELYRGDLVETGGEWVLARADHLRARYVAALIRAGELSLAAGDPQAAAEFARRAEATEPWTEAAYRLLASAELATGARGAARRTLARCRAMLTDLGVEPEPSTMAIERLVGGVVSSAP